MVINVVRRVVNIAASLTAIWPPESRIPGFARNKFLDGEVSRRDIVQCIAIRSSMLIFRAGGGGFICS